MRTGSFLRTAAWTAALLAGTLVTDGLAIVVAPTAVYLTERTPGAAVSLYNPSEVPEEVSVDVIFGYPTTDEQGNVRYWTDIVVNEMVMLGSTGGDAGGGAGGGFARRQPAQPAAPAPPISQPDDDLPF